MDGLNFQGLLWIVPLCIGVCLLLLPPCCPLFLAVLWFIAECYWLPKSDLSCSTFSASLGNRWGFVAIITGGWTSNGGRVCALLCPALVVPAPLEVVQCYVVVLAPLEV